MDRISHTWVERAPLEEFEAELTARTQLPPGSNTGLAGMSDDDLRSEASITARTIKRFAAAVASAMDESSTIDSFVSTLDLRLIEHDHDWRGVFSALQRQSRGFEQHKLVALRKYLQFLLSRRELLDLVLAERQSLEETSRYEEPTQPSPARLAKLQRLPIGESVTVRLPEQGTLPMRLGKHAFGLSERDAPRLVDQNGHEHRLRKGRQTVGRHSESDIRTDPNLNDISRLHVSIDWLGDDRLRITDLSSRGTFIDGDAICED